MLLYSISTITKLLTVFEPILILMLFWLLVLILCFFIILFTFTYHYFYYDFIEPKFTKIIDCLNIWQQF